MFGRPPSGGLLSFRDGAWMVQGAHRVSALGRTCARRSFAVCRLRWAAQHSAKMRYCCVEVAVPAAFPSARPPVRQNSHRHLRSSRALAILCSRKMRGVLPEIGWFSSNERTLDRTLRSSVEVKNEKPQVNVLRLLPSDGSMSPIRCHVDENHPISGMLMGSDCITARERKLFCCS